MASETSGLQYTESGQGEPVILLDWTPWQSTALADALATRYRVFSVDPPDAATTSEDVATAVAGTAGAAGLASYALVGASIGANVAFQVALLSPESVSTLALVSPDCVEPLTQRPWNTPELAVATMLAHPEFPAYHSRNRPGRQRWRPSPIRGERPLPAQHLGCRGSPAPPWWCLGRRTGSFRGKPAACGRSGCPTAASATSMTLGTPSQSTAPTLWPKWCWTSWSGGKPSSSRTGAA